LQVPTVSHREHAAYLQTQRLHHVLLKMQVPQLGVLLLEVVLPPKMHVPQLGARREVVVLLKMQVPQLGAQGEAVVRRKRRAHRLYRKVQALGHSLLDTATKMLAS